MKTATLVPTCTSFTATALRCRTCGKQMRLTTAEPHSTAPDLELRTYRCISCDAGESYLIHL